MDESQDVCLLNEQKKKKKNEKKNWKNNLNITTQLNLNSLLNYFFCLF